MVTFFGYQVLGLVTLVQDDETVALSVPASQPLYHMEEAGARQHPLGSGVRQITAGTIASVNVLVIHCLKKGLLQGRYEQAVCDEHDSLLVVLVDAALWQPCATLHGHTSTLRVAHALLFVSLPWIHPLSVQQLSFQVAGQLCINSVQLHRIKAAAA